VVVRVQAEDVAALVAPRPVAVAVAPVVRVVLAPAVMAAAAMADVGRRRIASRAIWSKT
jgi:hypothetical protein